MSDEQEAPEAPNSEDEYEYVTASENESSNCLVKKKKKRTKTKGDKSKIQATNPESCRKERKKRRETLANNQESNECLLLLNVVDRIAKRKLSGNDEARDVVTEACDSPRRKTRRHKSKVTVNESQLEESWVEPINVTKRTRSKKAPKNPCNESEHEDITTRRKNKKASKVSSNESEDEESRTRRKNKKAPKVSSYESEDEESTTRRKNKKATKVSSNESEDEWLTTRQKNKKSSKVSSNESEDEESTIRRKHKKAPKVFSNESVDINEEEVIKDEALTRRRKHKKAVTVSSNESEEVNEREDLKSEKSRKGRTKKNVLKTINGDEDESMLFCDSSKKVKRGRKKAEFKVRGEEENDDSVFGGSCEEPNLPEQMFDSSRKLRRRTKTKETIGQQVRTRSKNETLMVTSLLESSTKQKRRYEELPKLNQSTNGQELRVDDGEELLDVVSNSSKKKELVTKPFINSFSDVIEEDKESNEEGALVSTKNRRRLFRTENVDFGEAEELKKKRSNFREKSRKKGAMHEELNLSEGEESTAIAEDPKQITLRNKDTRLMVIQDAEVSLGSELEAPTALASLELEEPEGKINQNNKEDIMNVTWTKNDDEKWEEFSVGVQWEESKVAEFEEYLGTLEIHGDESNVIPAQGEESKDIQKVIGVEDESARVREKTVKVSFEEEPSSSKKSYEPIMSFGAYCKTLEPANSTFLSPVQKRRSSRKTWEKSVELGTPLKLNFETGVSLLNASPPWNKNKFVATPWRKKKVSDTKIPKRLKMPDFNMIRQKAQDMIENVAEHLERKNLRAQLLLSGNKVPIGLGNQLTNPNTKKQLQFTSSLKTPKKIGKTSKNQQQKENPPFIKLTNSGKKRLKTPKKIMKNLENSSTLDRKSKLKSPRKYAPVPSIVPLIQSSVGNPFSVGKSKVVEKVVPGVSKQQIARDLVMKKKMERDRLQESRSTLKGVRLNRRFDLLMNMREGKKT